MEKLEELTKSYIDQRLGQEVLVNNIQEGIIGYEHNSGRLAIYSTENKLIGFLKSGDKIKFNSDSSELVFPKRQIKE